MTETKSDATKEKEHFLLLNEELSGDNHTLIVDDSINTKHQSMRQTHDQ